MTGTRTQTRPANCTCRDLVRWCQPCLDSGYPCAADPLGIKGTQPATLVANRNLRWTPQQITAAFDLHHAASGRNRPQPIVPSAAELASEAFRSDYGQQSVLAFIADNNQLPAELAIERQRADRAVALHNQIHSALAAERERIVLMIADNGDLARELADARLAHAATKNELAIARAAIERQGRENERRGNALTNERHARAVARSRVEHHAGCALMEKTGDVCTCGGYEPGALYPRTPQPTAFQDPDDPAPSRFDCGGLGCSSHPCSCAIDKPPTADGISSTALQQPRKTGWQAMR
jgi:hypothetical protein